MDIIRARSIEILKLISPHFILHDEACRLPFLKELAGWLTQAPDMIQITVAMEGDSVCGFVIAQNPGAEYPHINVPQAWSDASNDFDVIQDMFVRVLHWAVALNKTWIKAETMRDEFRAMYKRFGFHPISQNMRCDLSPSLTSTLLALTKESLSWQAQHSVQSQQ